MKYPFFNSGFAAKVPNFIDLTKQKINNEKDT